MKKAPIKKIIFIIADTLRAQNVGIYGANPSPTPNLDNLAESSLIFDNAYTSITKTDPSISSIMTGKYPISLGLVNHAKNITKEEEKNLRFSEFLPEVLKGNGFYTAAVDWMSRWHKRGFNLYTGKLINRVNMRYIGGDRTLLFFMLMFADKMLVKFFGKEVFMNIYYNNFSNANVLYDPADLVVEQAIRILKENKKKPLYLYLHFWDAHAPHLQPRNLKHHLLDNVNDNYNAEVSFIDKELGRLIDYLKTTNQIDETLIIITSDHGENFSEHEHIPFAHEGLYEEVVKIPLIIRLKGLKPQRVNALVQHVDIFPTILDLLGIPINGNIDGKSLLPIIFKKKQGRKEAFFLDIKFRKISIANKEKIRLGIKGGKYKYIATFFVSNKNLLGFNVNPQKLIQQKLYDLQKDPKERENLIEKKPEIANKLRSQLINIIDKLNAKRMQNNYRLKAKVEKSISVIRQAVKRFKDKEIALAWTGGKDSTVLLHLARLAFGGKVPFKIIFNDSTMEFEEIYKFNDQIARIWGIKVITIKHSDKELREFHATKDHQKKKEASRLMKITAINTALKKYKLKALMAAIRWDEHDSRSKEKYFSPRPDHMRIHPMLHFTEKDVWEYINHFGVPYVDLYDKGYRSLGEKPFTKKSEKGGGERSGRERDKEQLMERLRKMGYW